MFDKSGWRFILFHIANLAAGAVLVVTGHEQLGGTILGGTFGLMSSDVIRGRFRAVDAPEQGSPLSSMIETSSGAIVDPGSRLEQDVKGRQEGKP